jgi:phospholipid/cholesterol/gamma-HCH transport system substrate-binding protein
MENKSHALAAGTFVIALAALLIALAAWLARDTSERRIFELGSREAVTGLSPQAGVRYKGVLVGRVAAIELDTKNPGSVVVRIAVNDAAPITHSTFATLGFQGVTGLAFIQLDDSGESTAALASGSGQPARIPIRQGLMSRLTDQGTSLLGQLDQASQRANQLLAAENQKALVNAISSLGQAATNVGQLAKHVDQMMAGKPVEGQPNLPVLMQEASATLQAMQATAVRLNSSADSVKASSAEFKRMSARMNEPGGTLDKIAEGAGALVATSQALNSSVVPRLSRTTEDAARAVRQVGRAADAVNENPQSLLLGKGAPTAGPGERGFVTPPSR